jgi:hypothetical protein
LQTFPTLSIKQSSLVRTLANYDGEKFYNIGPWCSASLFPMQLRMPSPKGRVAQLESLATPSKLESKAWTNFNQRDRIHNTSFSSKLTNRPIKLEFLTVNNPDKFFITLAQGGKHKYCCNLPQYFNPKKVGLNLPW